MTARTELVNEVAQSVEVSESVYRACNAVVDAVSTCTNASVNVLLTNANYLYLGASSGVWYAPRAVSIDYGLAGRVLTTGHTAMQHNTPVDHNGPLAGRQAGSMICAPVRSTHETVIGVILVEFDVVPADPRDWESVLTKIGALLGTRIHQLGGPAEPSPPQWLLSHALSIATAKDLTELAARVCRAAVDLSGLRCAVTVVRRPNDAAENGPPCTVMADHCGSGSRRLVDAVGAMPPESLSQLMHSAARHQSAYSRGEVGVADVDGFEPLVDAGVRTVVAAALPVDTRNPEFDAATLIMDELAVQPLPDTTVILELLMINAVASYERMSTQHKLQTLADSDPLTGLRHRRPLARQLASVAPSSTAVLAMDIDNFKAINDRWGHDAGDRALTEVARTICQALREGDEVFRVGGDEFVAVLNVAGHDEAVQVAERIAAAVADGGHTISIGVTLRRAEDVETTLRRADEALYAAKRDKRQADGGRPTSARDEVKRPGSCEPARPHIRAGGPLPGSGDSRMNDD
ncbi:GGDEF domain-containing protein [Catellatospora citrea]|uniref:GGDEF domain-containing protein n=1 Tax=Catellatospora citrea TaxID=53366 RepID=A0A8J3KBY3_9ACTN|nr:GGDEF domain-containing protein [Catellatospora citrea]RKE05483.1 diguanylate cyclase (GGDEF)-like protein [Catellatospora citrea]GIG00158.1 hypothetical protein Cci01nite_52510 [Catellatospora citrea]